MPLPEIASLFPCHLQNDSILMRGVLFCFVDGTKLHKAPQQQQHFVRQDRGCEFLLRAEHFTWLIFFGPHDVHSHQQPLPKEHILWQHQKQQFTNTCLQRSGTHLKTKMASLLHYSNKVLFLISEVMRQPSLLCRCCSVSVWRCCQLIRVSAMNLPCKLVKPLAGFVTDLRVQAIWI